MHTGQAGPADQPLALPARSALHHPCPERTWAEGGRGGGRGGGEIRVRGHSQP